MNNTDPKLVGLELDIMWAKVGGVEPVKVFEQFKGRIPLVHMKNVKGGIGPQYNEKVPKEAFEEVGKGVIAIGPVMVAAKKAGVYATGARGRRRSRKSRTKVANCPASMAARIWRMRSR